MPGMGSAVLRLLARHSRQCMGSQQCLGNFSALLPRTSSCAPACASLPAAVAGPTATDGSFSWAVGGAALVALTAAATTPAFAEGRDSSNSRSALESSASQTVNGTLGTDSKLLSLPMRQRIFFKYEKRIRDLSTLEKIFDYFATHERDGAKAMSSQDVVRALVPTYPPVGSNVERAGFLDGGYELSPAGSCLALGEARLLMNKQRRLSGPAHYSQASWYVVQLAPCSYLPA